MVLAAIQILVALIFGTVPVQYGLGPKSRHGDIGVGRVGWLLCIRGPLGPGTVANTQAQAGGLGVLAANALAALGGCWWPIEITPEWMQFVQKLIPTGWTMDALHKLISFQAGAASVIPNIAMLLVAAAVFGGLAVRSFRYE